MKTFLTPLLAALSMAALGFLPFVPSLELPSVEAAPRTSTPRASTRRTARAFAAPIQKTSGLGPSARAAARLKNAPPRGWVGHYLPDDRYKVAGGIWKYVTTENDTYFHSPSCPLMLRQSAGSVIGFASVADAEEAGYRFDAGCISHAKTERYVMQQRNQRRESQVRGRQRQFFPSQTQGAGQAEENPFAPINDEERRYVIRYNKYLEEMREWSAGNRGSSLLYTRLRNEVMRKQARGQKPTDDELQALSRAKNGLQSNFSSVPQQPVMPRSMAERVRRLWGDSSIESVRGILRDERKALDQLMNQKR